MAWVMEQPECSEPDVINAEINGNCDNVIVQPECPESGVINAEIIENCNNEIESCSTECRNKAEDCHSDPEDAIIEQPEGSEMDMRNAEIDGDVNLSCS